MLSYRLPELSLDSLNLSVKNNPHDTLIEICDRTSGDIKTFNADSSVLCRRCEYFRVALSGKWRRKVDDKYKLRLDVPPNAFEIILKGINSGTIILENLNTNILMGLMLISDILLFHEFFNILRSKLDEKRDKNKEWRDKDIVTILRTSYQISSAQDLYLFCQDIFLERPQILFEYPEFSSIDEELLLRILKLDMICLSEKLIFDKLIEWGTAKNPSTSNKSISALGVTLKNVLQLIRYKSMSEEEMMSIFNKFERILPTKEVRYKLPPRISSPIEPKVISSCFIGLIATWIGGKDPIEVPYNNGFNIPFQFKLVFRMGDMDDQTDNHKYYNKSSNGFLPTMKCHHGPSLMIMKLKGSEKIIGAYNPINWKKGLPKKEYAYTSESFIFSSENRYGTNHQLSRVRDFDHAICLEDVKPSGVILKFGEDLIFNYIRNMRKYVSCSVRNEFYEQPIILNKGTYEIEKWEIFRVSRKDRQPISKEVNPPRVNPPIETKIIDSDFIGLIATWIEKKNPMKTQYTGSNMPFKFAPLFRMNGKTFDQECNVYHNQSTNGFLPTIKCHHGPSLMIMKLKTGKIIGAYNPINWKKKSEVFQHDFIYEPKYETTSESFIFSSEDMHGTNHKLSRVKDFNRAIRIENVLHSSISSGIFEVPNGVLLGFGKGLSFIYNDEQYERTPTVTCRVRRNECYEQPAIIAEGDYKIDEWEIFRVSRKENQIIEPKINNKRAHKITDDSTVQPRKIHKK